MRLIDADALCDAIVHDPKAKMCEYETYAKIIHMVYQQPTIDPAVHGEWIYDMNTNLDPLYICSRCGQWAFAGDKGKLPNYCENCGAKNGGE